MSAWPLEPDSAVRLACVATALCWLLAGVFWREPWKADEGYSFGIVLSMLRDGSWLVPTLAGEPFLEKPPFVYWIAALTGRALEGAIPLHVAARIGGTLIAAGAFGAVWSAARLILGAAGGRRAVLWLAACPAWLVGSGFLTADLGLVLASAMAVNGLVRLERRHAGAGPWLALAGLVGLLSKGLLMPAVLALTLAILLAARTDLRERRVMGELIRAAAIGAPLALLWPIGLWLRSPELFDSWFWANNVGRFLGHNRLGPISTPGAIIATGSLYLLPVWPAAAFAIAGFRNRTLPSGLASTALFALVWGVVVASSATARVNYLMPLMVPLAVVAAVWQPQAATRLLQRLRSALPTLTAVALLGVALCKGGLFLIDGDTGWGSSAGVCLPLLLMAAVVGSSFIYLARTGRLGSALGGWVMSMTLLWCFTLAVFLTPADQTTGFRAVFTEISDRIPEDAACIASHGLGESERGLLHYYGGLVTVRLEAEPANAALCPVLIEQERQGITDSTDTIGFGCPGMSVLWRGTRPEDHRNVFRLCRADPVVASMNTSRTSALPAAGYW